MEVEVSAGSEGQAMEPGWWGQPYIDNTGKPDVPSASVPLLRAPIINEDPVRFSPRGMGVEKQQIRSRPVTGGGDSSGRVQNPSLSVG